MRLYGNDGMLALVRGERPEMRGTGPHQPSPTGGRGGNTLL
jgi:hypothetical protein